MVTFEELKRQLEEKCGKVDLDFIIKLSHLIREDDKKTKGYSARQDFLLSYINYSYGSSEDLDKYADEINKTISELNLECEKINKKIDSNKESSSNIGHETLLGYYLCRKYENFKDYGKTCQFINDIPLIIYLHDLFKGFTMKGGDEVETFKNIYRLYDIVTSIAEEAPELINVGENEKKDKYAVAKFSPIFQTIVEDIIGPPNNTEVLDKYVWKKLLAKDIESNKIIKKSINRVKSLLNKENTQAVKDLAMSLLLKPQRSWYSGNDISVLAHMKGAFYVYLLSRGAKLITIKNPFFDPASLKDLLGASVLLTIFSQNLNDVLFEKMRISKGILPDIELLKDDNIDLTYLTTPFTAYTTLEEIHMIIPSKIDIKEVIENATNRTLKAVYSKVLGSQIQGSSSREYITIHYDIMKTLTLNKGDEKEMASKVNEFFIAPSQRKSFEHTTSYDTYLKTSEELCDKCKTRYALPEDVLNELEKKIKFRNEIVGRKERLCYVCSGVRLGVLFEKERERRSVDEIGDNLVLMMFKIDPHVPESKVAYVKAEFERVRDEVLRIVNEKIRELRGKEGIINNYLSLRPIKEKIDVNNLKEFLSPNSNDEFTDEDLEKYSSEIDLERVKEYNDCMLALLLVSLKFSKKDAKDIVGVVKSSIDKIKNDLPKECTGNRIYENLNSLNVLKKQDMRIELTIQDSIDRRFSQMIEFYFIVEDFIEKLRKEIDGSTSSGTSKIAVLVPPSVFSTIAVIAINYSDFKNRHVIDLLNSLQQTSYIKYDRPVIKVYLVRMNSTIPIRNIIHLINSHEDVRSEKPVVFIPLYVSGGLMSIENTITLEKIEYEKVEGALEELDKLSEEHYLVKDRRFLNTVTENKEILSSARLIKR